MTFFPKSPFRLTGKSTKKQTNPLPNTKAVKIELNRMYARRE